VDKSRSRVSFEDVREGSLPLQGENCLLFDVSASTCFCINATSFFLIAKPTAFGVVLLCCALFGGI
jgi:hypothetical protein